MIGILLKMNTWLWSNTFLFHRKRWTNNCSFHRVSKWYLLFLYFYCYLLLCSKNFKLNLYFPYFLNLVDQRPTITFFVMLNWVDTELKCIFRNLALKKNMYWYCAYYKKRICRVDVLLRYSIWIHVWMMMCKVLILLLYSQLHVTGNLNMCFDMFCMYTSIYLI